MDVFTSRIGRMTALLMVVAVALAAAALACTAADENSGTGAGGAVGSGTPGAPPGVGGPVGTGTAGGAGETPAASPPPAAGGGAGSSIGGTGVVDGDREYVRRPAPIESVAVRVAESMPPQYFVDIVSGLPNGCATFEDHEVTRGGDTVSIMVWNREPAPDSNVACTMVYGFVEHSIALGSDFVAGRTYTVMVNDRTTTFTAQ